jgi:hypothetical protein
MPALLVLFPTAHPALLLDAHAILSQLPKVIGLSVLDGFGHGALGAVQQYNSMFGLGGFGRNAHTSLLAAYSDALKNLTTHHMAGQYLQRVIAGDSSAGSMLQSRLDAMSSARLIAVANLQQLMR